jgi:hypothetical protein
MPYRNAELSIDDPPPREHLYEPIHRRAFNSAAPGCIVGAPIAVGAIVAGMGFPIAGLVAAIGSGVGLWFLHKKSRSRGSILFTVDGGRLIIERRDSNELGDAISLGAIEDVVLDTKTVERVQDGSPLIPALQAINATVGPPADTARIEIVTRKRSIFLTNEFLSYTETSDAIAKLRVFLRKNGWVPIDEREIDAHDIPEEPAPRKRKKKRRSKPSGERDA